MGKKSHKANSVKKSGMDSFTHGTMVHRSPIPTMGGYKNEPFRQPNLNKKGFSVNSDSLRGKGVKIKSDNARQYMDDDKSSHVLQKYQLEKRISTSVSTKSKVSLRLEYVFLKETVNTILIPIDYPGLVNKYWNRPHQAMHRLVQERELLPAEFPNLRRLRQSRIQEGNP